MAKIVPFDPENIGKEPKSNEDVKLALAVIAACAVLVMVTPQILSYFGFDASPDAGPAGNETGSGSSLGAATPGPFTPYPGLPTPYFEPGTPAWKRAGFRCAVPDGIVGEPWAKQYLFQCACDVRAYYDLGDYFTVWEGCRGSGASAWRRESCDCLDQICYARPDIC